MSEFSLGSASADWGPDLTLGLKCLFLPLLKLWVRKAARAMAGTGALRDDMKGTGQQRTGLPGVCRGCAHAWDCRPVAAARFEPRAPGGRGRRGPAAAAEHRLRLGMDDAIEELLLGVGGGDTSVARMARLAAGFLRAGGPESAALQPLADLGKQRQNAERGLHRWSATQPWRLLFPPSLYEFAMPKLGLKGDYGEASASTHSCASAAILPCACPLPPPAFARCLMHVHASRAFGVARCIPLPTSLPPPSVLSSLMDAQTRGKKGRREGGWERRRVEVHPRELGRGAGSLRAGAGAAGSLHAGILPHELFASLHRQGSEVFHELLCGSDGVLAEWWREAQARGGAWLENPFLNEAPPHRSVPLVRLQEREIGPG